VAGATILQGSIDARRRKGRHHPVRPCAKRQRHMGDGPRQAD
jgi:hypothetical protein